MKAYKGFEKRNGKLYCRDFEFEEGKTYEEPEAKLCDKGFHACENPINCFSYYSPNESEYHEVELEDVSDERHNDTKIVAKKIKIGPKLDLADLAEISANFISENANWKESVVTNMAVRSIATNTDNKSVATNLNYESAATNTGDNSVATSAGSVSAATNIGNCSVATSKYYRSAATNTGNNSVATNEGEYSAATNTGDFSAATSKGGDSISANTGDSSVSTSKGDDSISANTGDNSVSTSKGDRSASVSTGIGSTSTNTGYNSVALSVGYSSDAEVSGLASVAISIGRCGKAKANKGNAIVLCEKGKWNGKNYPLKAIKAAIVDGEKIKADTWYTLRNGEFVEAKD